MAMPEGWLTQLPAPAGTLEPVQRRGRLALSEHSFPSRRQESWRLTDLRRPEALFQLSLAEQRPHRSSADSWPRIPAQALRLVIDGSQDPLQGVTLPTGISLLEGAELQQALGHTLSRCRCASARAWTKLCSCASLAWPRQMMRASAVRPRLSAPRNTEGWSFSST